MEPDASKNASNKTRNADDKAFQVNQGCLFDENLSINRGTLSNSTKIQDTYKQRQRFLQLLLMTKGKEITLKMHQNTIIVGNFEAVDDKCNALAVSTLRTPIGIQRAALIRTSDIISFSTS